MTSKKNKSKKHDTFIDIDYLKALDYILSKEWNSKKDDETYQHLQSIPLVLPCPP